MLRGKSAAICRDVKQQKKGHVDSKFKIQKFGRKIRRKRIQNITNRDSTNFRHQAALPCLPSRVLFCCLHRGIIRALLTRSTIGGIPLLRIPFTNKLSFKSVLLRFFTSVTLSKIEKIKYQHFSYKSLIM